MGNIISRLGALNFGNQEEYEDSSLQASDDEPEELDEMSVKAVELAKGIIYDARTKEREHRYFEADALYSSGISSLLKVCKGLTIQRERTKLQIFISTCLDEREKVNKHRKILQERWAKAKITIQDGEVGRSFDSLFKNYLDESVTSVTLEDRYILKIFQLDNMIMLFNVLKERAVNLKEIKFIASSAFNKAENSDVRKKFEELQESIKEYGIDLLLEIDDRKHDRVLRINKWTIILGRGIEIYKYVQRSSLAFFNQKLRPCYESNITFYHADDEDKQAGPN